MTTSILPSVEIRYDRETRDYACYLIIDGQENYIGSARTYSDGEILCQNEYSTFYHQAPVEKPAVEEIPPIAILAETAEALSAAARDAGDTRNANALNKAMLDLHTGVRPTRTTGGWLIASATRGGLVHRVNDHHGCSCEAGSNGKPCRHAAMIEIIQVSQDRAIIAPQVSIDAIYADVLTECNELFV